MEKFLPILQKTKLFAGLTEQEIFSMLGCLDAKTGVYQRGSAVLSRGDTVNRLAILLEGALHIQRDDYWGKRSLLSRIAPGELFGEAYIASESGVFLNDVIAVEDSTVIFFDVSKILTTCTSACLFHTLVVRNLFFALSEKNRRLVRKLDYLSGHSIRERLISYLSDEAGRQGSGSFSIPFNRQQLAEFLSVDRSALSKELCKMRDEGLLEFEKNRFKLL
ncbi:MAG: Crp/Fnr family transcriptional regulator [Clostridia bacterium]|nr:Crp/Fnr family transcriptional regulator [Clostridia bacterium]